MKDNYINNDQESAVTTPLPIREEQGGGSAESKATESGSALLLKAIFGTLTPEDTEVLQTWREADEANELLYRQTTDPDFLQREYAKRQSVDYARPLAEMQSRIGIRGRKARLRPFLLGAAASLALVLLAGALAYLYIYQRPAQEIQPGAMRATLQVLNGTDAPITIPVSRQAVTDTPVSTQELLADYHAQVTAPSQTGRAGEESISLTTPRGGEFRVTLEDGTEVWLNAQSQLIYPETFSDAERRVQVEGEAYFHVAHNEQKPFLVETDGQLIRVLGTEFNVRSYAEDDAVQTTLVRGSIAMQPIGAGAAQLLLTPGHQALFDKTEHDINVRRVDTEVVTSWREGRFVFENQTLEQIMLTLSRWYDFSYHFADRRAARTEFMGSIPRYADFADVIAILEGSGGLHVSVKGRTVTIESKHN